MKSKNRIYIHSVLAACFTVVVNCYSLMLISDVTGINIFGVETEGLYRGHTHTRAFETTLDSLAGLQEHLDSAIVNKLAIINHFYF